MAVWLPPVNIPSFSGGPDYSANLYNGLSGIGDAFVANRNARTQQSQFAQGLALDQQRLAQAQTIADRNYALNLKKYDLAAQKLSAGGGGTNDIKNYEYAVANGYKGDFSSYQRSKLPTGVSNISPDHMLVTGSDGSLREVVIPDSPTDKKQKADAAKANSGAQHAALQGDIVLDSVDQVRKLVKGQTFINPITGAMGDVAAHFGGTGAFDARDAAKAITSNTAIDRLQQMRKDNPTGGAMGNISDQDMALLQATMGSLSLSQSSSQFLYNLDRFEKTYKAIMALAVAYPNAADYGIGGAASPGAAPAGQQDGSGNTWEPVN